PVGADVAPGRGGSGELEFCGSAEGGRTAAALYSVVATCKHLRIDPFAHLCDLLPALYALGDSPHEEALGDWVPDAWQKRQQASNPRRWVAMAEENPDLVQALRQKPDLAQQAAEAHLVSQSRPSLLRRLGLPDATNDPLPPR